MLLRLKLMVEKRIVTVALQSRLKRSYTKVRLI